MAKRKSTPTSIETEVLTLCARRCCICFGIQMDLSHKKGQIAHLDGDPSNYNIDNLAFLCMFHHDEYDSKTSQSKGFTIDETKKYRTLLYEAINQMRSSESHKQVKKTKDNKKEEKSRKLTELIGKLHTRSIPLSESLVLGLAYGQEYQNSTLEQFCRTEISGYSDKTKPIPKYRIIEVFITGNARINMQWPFWGQNSDNVIEFMRQDKKYFVPIRLGIAHSLSSIETQIRNYDVSKGLITFLLRMKDINPNHEKPDAEIAGYAHPSSYNHILESVRRELTILLLDMIPKIE